VQTIESIIDVRIDHVAVIDFEGFAGLTDALGGVPVNNEIAFTRGGVNYAAGPITLDGDHALGFVRERYSFTDGDYQRV
ncbi:LCP family protein, partial [Rhizobium johnstonii]